MNQSFYLGQCIEFKRTFEEPDLHKMADVLNLTGLMGKLEMVTGILAASTIMARAAEAMGCGISLVQQEMIYNKPIRKGETIFFRMEIYHIDHYHHWLTVAVKALNEKAEELLRGQVVIEMESEEVLHNNRYEINQEWGIK